MWCHFGVIVRAEHGEGPGKVLPEKDSYLDMVEDSNKYPGSIIFMPTAQVFLRVALNPLLDIGHIFVSIIIAC